MPKEYEIMYIFDPALEAEKLIAKVNSIFQKHGAVLVKQVEWGKKRLAYDIKDCSEGYYVLATVEAKEGAVGRIHKELELDEDILRFIIITKSVLG